MQRFLEGRLSRHAVIFWLICALLCGLAAIGLADDDTIDDDAVDDDDNDTAVSDPVQALVFVTDGRLGTIDPHTFGVNLVAGAAFGDDGGGLWSPETSACDAGIVGCYQPSSYDLLRRIGPGLLRFPGGRLTRSYDWREGIGPASGRAALFGTDEFLYLAQRLDATPVITLSLYDPDTGAFATDAVLEQALDWVRYVNEDSPFGPVFYWEVDSDTWENQAHPDNPDVAFKRVAPEAYAAAFSRMSFAIKQEFPEIQIGGVSYENARVDDTVRLLETFVASGADAEYWPDFLTLGYYRPNVAAARCDLWDRDLDTELDTLMRAAFAAGRELDERLGALINAADTVLGADKPAVPVLLSEYNTQLKFADTYTNYPGTDDPPACPFRDLVHSQGAAMFNADVLLTTLGYSDRLLGAALWNFMDDDPTDPGYYGSAFLLDGQVIQRPNGLALRLLARDFGAGDVVRTTTLVSTFDNEAVGRTPAYRSLSLGPDERYLRVRVVREREPIETTPLCGADNVHNPDPASRISGAFKLDNVSVERDDVPPTLSTNLLTNGDFQQPLNVGWQVRPDPAGVTTQRVCDTDNCALEVDFASGLNNNPAYVEQIWQTVEVEPGGRYRVKFDYAADALAVKTQNLLCDPSFDLTSTPGAFNNAYWVEFSSTPAPSEIVDDACYDGDQCVRVPIVGDPEYYHVRQRYTRPATDPDTYRVVGWIKTEDLDGPVTIEAQARNSDDQLIQAEQSFGLFDTNDWSIQDARLALFDPDTTAFINVHLRRKAGRKDDGVAYFDDLRLYRDEAVYAPRVVIDVCTDPACTVRRSIEGDGATGTRNWTRTNLGGTPLVKAVAARSDHEVDIALINRSLDRNAEVSVDLRLLEIQDGWPVFVSRLAAATPDADNEDAEPGEPLDVSFDGGVFLEDLDGGLVSVTLPPHSITSLKIVDPNVEQDDPDPTDDDDDTDVTGELPSLDDDDDQDADDDGAGGGCAC